MGNKIPKGNLMGKTCIITGGNRGIGFETARHIALNNGNVIIGCRDEKLGKEAVQRIQKTLIESKMDETKIEYMPLDLSSFKKVKEFSKLVKQRHHAVNILVNNAATFYHPTLEKTEDGLEVQFQVNYLSHFLLTQLLLDELLVEPESQIINVGAPSHQFLDIVFQKRQDFNDMINNEETYSPGYHYAMSKFFIYTCTTYALSNRLKNTNCSSNIVDPLAVYTDLYRRYDNSKRYMLKFFHYVGRLSSPERGAYPVLNLTMNPEMKQFNGKLFQGTSHKPKESSLLTYNVHLQNMMWNYSLSLLDQHLPGIKKK